MKIKTMFLIEATWLNGLDGHLLVSLKHFLEFEVGDEITGNQDEVRADERLPLHLTECIPEGVAALRQDGHHTAWRWLLVPLTAPEQEEYNVGLKLCSNYEGSFSSLSQTFTNWKIYSFKVVF